MSFPYLFSDSKAKMKENVSKHERKILAVLIDSKEKILIHK